MSKEELLLQAKVMELFNKAHQIGTKAFVNPSKALKILQDLPNNYSEDQDIVDEFDTMYNSPEKADRTLKEGFPFSNTDILALPHIKEAFNVLMTLKNKMEHIFHKHNKSLIKLSKDVNKLTNLTLDISSNKNLEKIRDEFIKYMLASIKAPIIENGKVVYEYNFDVRNEEPIDYKYRGRFRKATGTDAWNRKFINKIEIARKSIDNLFLKGLEIKTDYTTGLKYIKFTSLSNMDQADVLKYVAAFEELNTDPELKYNEFQRDFIKYSVLNQGLQFGSTNYSMVMPPDMYKEISAALDTSLNELFEEEKNVQKSDKEVYSALTKAKEHFALQLVIANANSLPPFWAAKPIKEKDKYSGIDKNGIVYDLKYKVSEDGLESYDKFPKFIFIEKWGNTVFIKMQEVEEDGIPVIYYQNVGKKPIGGAQYQADKKVFEEGYLMAKAFPSNIITRSVEDNLPSKEGKLKYPSKEEFKKGTEILMKNYSDITRTDALIYTISSKRKAKKSDNTSSPYIYTLKNSISLAEEVGLYEVPTTTEEEIDAEDSPIDQAAVNADENNGNECL
jgi:hypothetical protein